MKVSEIADRLGLTVLAGADALDNEVAGVYLGDLLSWVMGRAQEKNIWITIQGHVNVIAVALLTGVSCVVVAEGAEVAQGTVEKANDESIPLLSCGANSFELVKSIIEQGIA